MVSHKKKTHLIADLDLKILQLDEEIKKKRELLFKKRVELEEKKGLNQYLEIVHNDYNKFYEVEVNKKKGELEAMTILKDYISYLEDEKKFDYRSFSSINDNPSFFNPDPNAFSSLNGGSGGSNGGSIERGGGEMPNGFMDRDGGNGGNKNDEKQKEFLAQLEQYKNQRDSVVPQAPTRFG